MGSGVHKERGYTATSASMVDRPVFWETAMLRTEVWLRWRARRDRQANNFRVSSETERTSNILSAVDFDRFVDYLYVGR